MPNGFYNDLMFAQNADFTNSLNPSYSNGLKTDGQLWIGSTAPNAGGTNINVGTLTSPLGTLTIGYNSPNITIDVSGSGSVVETLTGNTGGPVPPLANNINVLGLGVVGSGISTVGNIITTGAGNTISVKNTQAQFMTNYVSVNHATGAPYVVLATDNYISCDPSAGTVVLNFPNSPTTNRIFTVKDRTGNAAVSNISITTVGGVVNIDGATTYKITSNFGSVNLLFNGTSYEVW